MSTTRKSQDDIDIQIQRYIEQKKLSDVGYLVPDIARHFANWQQQMMNNALDGELINDDGTYKLIVPALQYITCKYDEGDKFKVIIIKKE
jgi:hypothetical protein